MPLHNLLCKIAASTSSANGVEFASVLSTSVCHNVDERVHLDAPYYTTKYFACGWCTIIADVDCSGSMWKPLVSRTPMFSSGFSKANNLV
jgi:hypothetical protein